MSVKLPGAKSPAGHVMHWFLAHYEILKDFAAPIATIIAAFTAAGIAWHFGRVQAGISRQQAALSRQQTRLASTRLQYDLFEKRFSVYEATFYYLVDIVVRKEIAEETAKRFGLAANSAGFLFGSDLKSYLFRFPTKVLELDDVRDKLKNCSDYERRVYLLAKEKELFSWFEAEIPLMPLRFMPYLHIPHQLSVRGDEDS